MSQVWLSAGRQSSCVWPSGLQAEEVALGRASLPCTNPLSSISAALPVPSGSRLLRPQHCPQYLLHPERWAGTPGSAGAGACLGAGCAAPLDSTHSRPAFQRAHGMCPETRNGSGFGQAPSTNPSLQHHWSTHEFICCQIKGWVSWARI